MEARQILIDYDRGFIEETLLRDGVPVSKILTSVGLDVMLNWPLLEQALSGNPNEPPPEITVR